MRTTTLGSTHLVVSRIGLGLAALGRPGYINIGHADDLAGDYRVAAMEDGAHAVLNAAYDGGVRYFDTARSYGRGERFVGSWLRARGLSPEAVVVGSKWGYTYTAEWQTDATTHEIKEHSLENFERQWRESQATIGPYLNLYQIHSATIESRVLDNTKVLNALAQLKETGVAIGLTVSGRRQKEVIERSIELKIDGVRLFDTVQATWNLLEPAAGPALQTAADEGMGVIVKEALANGRLTERNRDPLFTTQRKVLRRVANRLNTTVDSLALAFILAQPWVDTVLSGAATVDHLRSNLNAVTVVWDDDAADALSGLAEAPERYWENRSRLVWN